MPEEVLVSRLIINELTTAQYENAKKENQLVDTEIYLKTDEVKVHNESVDAHPHILNELSKKLDSVATGTGLKTSNVVDGSQTIEIDDTIIFFLDGGTSTTVL